MGLTQPRNGELRWAPLPPLTCLPMNAGSLAPSRRFLTLLIDHSYSTKCICIQCRQALCSSQKCLESWAVFPNTEDSWTDSIPMTPRLVCKNSSIDWLMVNRTCCWHRNPPSAVNHSVTHSTTSTALLWAMLIMPRPVWEQRNDHLHRTFQSHAYCSEAQRGWDENIQSRAEGRPGSKSKVKIMVHGPQTWI